MYVYTHSLHQTLLMRQKGRLLADDYAELGLEDDL